MKQTAVEWLREKLLNPDVRLEIDMYDFIYKLIDQAKEMEKKEKIEFACQVAEASAEKYIQGKTTWQIAEELLTFKSE
jgi:uncharacterized protein (DUF1778 family)